MLEFGEKHHLSLGEPMTRQLLHEGVSAEESRAHMEKRKVDWHAEQRMLAGRSRKSSVRA
jgi:hypothetical protein